MRNRTLILGIGNILLGDEGVGVHVIDAIRDREIPAGTTLLDGGTGSFNLLEPMQTADRVILIDATIDDDEPGCIKKIFPRYSTDYPKTLTAHDIGLKDLIDAFYLSGRSLPEVVLFAITIPVFHELTTELSNPIAGVVPTIVEMVIEEASRPLPVARAAVGLSM